MTKISDLTALTGAGVDTAADLFPIVDMSAAGALRNKKITVDEAKIALGVGTPIAELDDVPDVNAPTPSNGDVLTWDSTPGEWVAAAPASGIAELDDIPDVNASTPANGDVLTWDSTPGEWVAAAPAGAGAFDLDDATDVNAPSPSNGDVLTWDSTPGEWVAQAPSGGSAGTMDFQATDLVITTNNAFQDTDISVSLTAGSYAIEAYYTTSSHATPDMESRFTYTGTVTDVAMIRHAARGSTTSVIEYEALPADYVMDATDHYSVYMHGQITVSDSGNFKIQVRQITSSATSVTFRKASWMRITPLV